MNIANQLTMLRIALVPVLILFMYLNNFWMRVFALVIFIGASITDLYDGVLARKYNTITTLGIFLDPLADKLLISAAFISFVGLKELHIPAWMVILIITREFVITGLRSLAASKNIIIAAHKSGKFKTTSQITAIIIMLLILITNSAMWRYYHMVPADLANSFDPRAQALGWVLTKLPFWLMLVVTCLTVYSGFSYLRHHRELLREK